MKFLPPAILPALAAFAFLPVIAFGMSTGENNSRLAVARALSQNYGLEGADLSSSLVAKDAGAVRTKWEVRGSAGYHRVHAEVLCVQSLFIYNKYSRAYRNNCEVESLLVR